MIQDSENKQPELNVSPEPSQEPSPAFNAGLSNQKFGIREIEATYEMLVHAKAAINRNDHWSGEDLESMAMLKAMIAQMESQYRSQLEQARALEKETRKKIKEEITKAGGQINGERRNGDTAAPIPATSAAN